MPTLLAPVAIQQFKDNNGNSLVGGQLYTYQAGTSIPAPSYTDATGTSANTNPVILNSRGEAPIWLTPGQFYKLVLQDASGVLIWTADQVPGGFVDATMRIDLAASSGSSLVGFLQAGIGAVGRTVQNKQREAVSVFDFMTPAQIADVQSNTALLDVTVPFNAAAATGKKINMPAGSYYITDRIQLVNNQTLQGEGRTASNFIIKSTFNMLATGVIRMGTSEPGAQVFDVGFRFQQADQSVRASVTAYPPAIDAINIPRFVIDRMRIEAGYDGIKATGNCGGAYIGYIEFGTLNKGVVFDGSYDFIHGGNWNFWPFGLTSTTNLINVYYDGVTKACEFGRVDGLDVNSITAFRSWVEFTVYANPSPPNLINVLHLDGDGARLVITNGVVGIGQIYETKSAAPIVPTICATAGSVTIGALFSASSNASQILYTSGTGTIVVNGGRLNFNNANNSAVVSTAGKIALNNVEMVPGALAYANAHVVGVNNGIIQISNCKWPGRGTGSGAAIQLGNDLADNLVQNNEFRDWNYIAPSTITNGTYGPNASFSKSWSPVVTFFSNGDFVPTYVAQTGKYREMSGGLQFECRVVFNTNAFTTTSGQFSIIGLPINKGATTVDASPIPVGRVSQITLSTGFTMIGANISNGGSKIDFYQSGSAVSTSGIGPANILPSKTNVEITMAGFISSF